MKYLLVCIYVGIFSLTYQTDLIFFLSPPFLILLHPYHISSCPIPPGFKLLLEVFSVIHGPQEECVRALRNGHLLGISPGGVREALFSDETYPLLWGKRKGFAQVAIDSQVVCHCSAVTVFEHFYEKLQPGVHDIIDHYSWLEISLVLLLHYITLFPSLHACSLYMCKMFLGALTDRCNTTPHGQSFPFCTWLSFLNFKILYVGNPVIYVMLVMLFFFVYLLLCHSTGHILQALTFS